MSDEADTTVITRTVTRTVVPLILVTAIAFLLQGHNLPGGGFIAGVMTATAVALIYVVFGQAFLETDIIAGSAVGRDGTREVGTRQVSAFLTVFALGLTIAAGSGLVPILFEAPFLTQAVVFVEHLPIVHDIELTSAFAFDFGVYLVVVGALLTVLAVVGAE
ncbi:sodium:proton antiporter [Haladaptatus sp. R4]|uniref:MnhB domain-containing protein n=1 Tax=Haladaptatus sp. R4 TaxID=1679489 RepID=UPI0007B4DDD5|nr:MnhB domain-containing protein [Haladaptatus sp. R4]KZN22830.1 sodium:proton antiporter [Haladaptatus sp. R4]